MKSKSFTKDFVKEGGVGLLLQILTASRDNRFIFFLIFYYLFIIFIISL